MSHICIWEARVQNPLQGALHNLWRSSCSPRRLELFLHSTSEEGSSQRGDETQRCYHHV